MTTSLKEFYSSSQSPPNPDHDELFNPHSKIMYNADINSKWAIYDEEWCDDSDEDEDEIYIPSYYRGPYVNIDDVIKKCVDGDQILVYRDCRLYNNFKGKNIHIIGMNDAATISMHSGNKIEGSNIFIENVQIVCGTAFEICSNSSLWLKNCNINFSRGTAVSTHPNSNLYVNNCSFFGEKQGHSAIAPHPLSQNVFIVDSTFCHCGNESKYKYIGESSCIEIIINHRAYMYRHILTDTTINLKVIGNTFVDNHGYPIASRENGGYASEFIINDDQFEIKDNKLDGYNAIDSGHVTIDDPDCFWINEQHRKDTRPWFEQLKDLNMFL